MDKEPSEQSLEMLHSAEVFEAWMTTIGLERYVVNLETRKCAHLNVFVEMGVDRV